MSDQLFIATEGRSTLIEMLDSFLWRHPKETSFNRGRNRDELLKRGEVIVAAIRLLAELSHDDEIQEAYLELDARVQQMRDAWIRYETEGEPY